jgi:ParB-like nuclease domain
MSTPESASPESEPLTIHPLAEKFPPLSDSDYQELKASIAAYGVFEPIVINEKNQVLDGRHRWKACTELGKTPLTITHRILQKAATEPLSEEQFIYDSNIKRRHLSDDQRVMLASVFLPYIKAETAAAKAESQLEGRTSDGKPKLKDGSVSQDTDSPKSKRDTNAGKASTKLAAKAGVSRHKAEQAITVAENAPKLVSAVAAGEMTLKEAAKQAKPGRAPYPRVKYGMSLDQRAMQAARLSNLRADPTSAIDDEAFKFFEIFCKVFSDDCVHALTVLEHCCHLYLEDEWRKEKGDQGFQKPEDLRSHVHVWTRLFLGNIHPSLRKQAADIMSELAFAEFPAMTSQSAENVSCPKSAT